MQIISHCLSTKSSVTISVAMNISIRSKYILGIRNVFAKTYVRTNANGGYDFPSASPSVSKLKLVKVIDAQPTV